MDHTWTTLLIQEAFGHACHLIRFEGKVSCCLCFDPSGVPASVIIGGKQSHQCPSLAAQESYNNYSHSTNLSECMLAIMELK